MLPIVLNISAAFAPTLFNLAPILLKTFFNAFGKVNNFLIKLPAFLGRLVKNFAPFLNSLPRFFNEKKPRNAANVLPINIVPLIMNLVKPLHAFLNVSLLINSKTAFPKNPPTIKVAASINLS